MALAPIQAKCASFNSLSVGWRFAQHFKPVFRIEECSFIGFGNHRLLPMVHFIFRPKMPERIFSQLSSGKHR